MCRPQSLFFTLTISPLPSFPSVTPPTSAGTPSGGDWAVGRSGALFFEGTVGATVQGCFLTQLDGNAIFMSGYARNATIVQNEFLNIGETAIAQWGYSDGSPVPGMGFDLTAGNQPRGTTVAYNLVHEVGLYTKQNR